MPTLVGGSHPLHNFLSYSPEKHVILLTLRDPSDGRKMPPNGNDHVSAHCTRGVRKVRAKFHLHSIARAEPLRLCRSIPLYGRPMYRSASQTSWWLSPTPRSHHRRILRNA